MEKKTIGKFIAALRKANGMTQKEFGEKLFVSDKTVSRWECDECTPELSLIPTIAELFGITTDELLRGERSNPEREMLATEETLTKQKAKSDRQFRLMIDSAKRKYQNLTLISVGISILGFLSAVIANLGFYKGLIAFCLAAAFSVASEICQICFAVNVRILADEDDNTYTERIETFNIQTVLTAIKISFINIILLAFCAPLVTMINGATWGLAFDDWSFYGLMFSAVAFAVCYILYTLFIRKALCEKGLLRIEEKQKAIHQRNNKLLLKIAVVSIAITLVITVCISIWSAFGQNLCTKKYTFDNCSDFKAFMESNYDTWLKEGYNYVNENGNVVVEIPIDTEYTMKTYEQIKNADGEIICEYYYNPNLYRVISFTESADDKMPVTVITTENYFNGRSAFLTTESILYALIPINFIVAAVIYWIKINKRKKNS